MYKTPKVTSYHIEVFLRSVEMDYYYITIKKGLMKFMPWFLNHGATTGQYHFAGSQPVSGIAVMVDEIYTVYNR